MSRYFINLVVFLVGLAAAGWIGAGYVGSNPLALGVTLLIALFYMAGAFELYRYGRATSGLRQAVAGLDAPPASLAGWLDSLPPSLRHAARLRIEGERAALPGPSLTPYLVGLLVLLGMLGTFLGMVVTLRGTGLALESATDLHAIRASLAAPVKGLGFAFGTSIAGVATSAMLGLLSALCRRDRILASQQFDARVATTLRPYSQSYQREETLKLLQRQADAMPALAERLQAMIDAVERQGQAMNDRQLASQDAFQGKAEAAYSRLAASVEQTLKASVADSARAAGAALQPVVEATMTGLARETAALRDTVSDAVQRQLDGLSAGFRASTADVAGIWARALDGQQRANETLANDLRVSLDQFASTFEQRSAALMDGMSTRMEASAGKLSDVWDGALSRQERAGEKLAGDNQQALAAAAAALERQSAALVQAVSQSHADLQAALMARDEQRLAAWNASLGSVSASLRQEWEQAAAQTAGRQQEICDALALTAQRISDHTQLQAGETIAEISRLVQAAADAPKAAAALQAELAARDQDRLQAWTASLENMTAALRQEWQQAGAEAASRQREICDALSLAAQNISEQARTQASGTLAEINRLVDAAADAPKAALALQDELAARDRERLDAWSGSLAEMTAALRQEWQQAGADAANRQREICDALALAAQRISEQTQAQASGTLAEINRLVDAAADAPKAALALQGELAARDRERLDAWSGSLAEMTAALRQEWQQAGADAANRQREICDALALAAQRISEQTQAQASGTLAEINRLVDAAAEAPKAAVALQAELVARDQARLDAWTGTLAEMAATLRQEWQQAGADAASRQQQICEALADTARQISDQSRAHASDTLAEINRLVDAAAEAPKAAVALQSDLVARDEARLDAWTGSLADMAAALREEWQQTGAATASRQQEICDALAQAARDISEHTHTHASATIAEIERLAQAASEAPRAAAEVIGELRQKLSDSLAHDNAMLEERGRLLDTLATLLDAVNLASTEQRAAVDALVGTTSELMDRVGAQFSERVESETGKLAEISAQVTGSAVEVASLGEAFGAAVQLFSASNDKLATQLERIEAALDKSIARGDEQLSYYVSQAREVVDLSLMSQKQIIEDLQHLASQRADAGTEAA